MLHQDYALACAERRQVQSKLSQIAASVKPIADAHVQPRPLPIVA
jgi:hypothetical protein